jgi:hypothetical protein
MRKKLEQAPKPLSNVKGFSVCGTG